MNLKSAPAQVISSSGAPTGMRSPSAFWSRVDVRGTDECWPWLRSVNTSGYGQITFNGERQVVHRIAYQLTKGEIPEGFAVDHLCFNKRCCNPRHLEAVTISVNNWRAYAHYGINGARTHCPSGHEYNEENTARYLTHRKCRTCARAHRRNYRARKRASLNDGPADRSIALPVELNAGGG